MKKDILKKYVTVAALAAILAVAGPPAAIAENAAAERSASYREGRKALDEERWDDAVRHFAAAAEAAGDDADAALYWRAYAHHKTGDRAAALAALAALGQRYPESRWRDDARALRLEIDDGSSGGGEELSPEDELKLLALNSLMQANSERALALLESFLEGDHSQELKKRALFVLSQNPSPRARELLVGTARGGRGQDLQLAALRYLGMARGESSAELEQIYGATSDQQIKKAILRSFMVGRDVASLRRIYDTEKDPELRLDAIRQLGLVRAGDELRDLYRSETSQEVRKHVVRALFLAGDAAALIEIYGQEKDPELRKEAIRGLGLTNREEARKELAAIYGRESDGEVRKAVLRALFLSQDAGRLIAIARAETDPELKRHAIRQISLIQSDEAVDFMMEILEE